MKSCAMLLAAARLALGSHGAFAQAKKPVVVSTKVVKATAVRTPVVKPPSAPTVSNPRIPPSRS